MASDTRKRNGGAEGFTAALGDYLARRGLKHSRQRERIAEIFMGLRGHVSVDELLARARREDRRVSLATVYRTMKLLAESGLAAAREFGDGQTRWEVAAGRAHHDHLICTACGEIVEFTNEQIEALQAAVARKHGFEVERHRLELYGRCARCRDARRGGGRS
ncbi:MAG TPA: transcriptional repressor [Anaeromyxobacter sp.]|nr:transcriptional repressor [Anaeromyxobacter sp.]